MSARWPSVGFALAVAVWSAALAFFGWGLSRPALDRVWMLRQELWSGRLARLSPPDRRLLQDSLQRHPRLAAWLLGDAAIGIVSANRQGWLRQPAAVAVRTPAAAGRRILQVRVDGPAGALPLQVVVTGDHWRRSAPVERPGEVDVGLPAGPRWPELITVEIEPDRAPADPAAPAVWLGFPGGR